MLFLYYFTFWLQVDSDWTTLIEAEIDTWKIKPITDHFLGLDGYLPNDVMKYLLSIPIIELLQPKNTKPPPLSTQGLKKLELIKDQVQAQFSIKIRLLQIPHTGI